MLKICIACSEEPYPFHGHKFYGHEIYYRPKVYESWYKHQAKTSTEKLLISGFNSII